MEGQINSPWRKSSYSGNGGGNCVEVASRRDVLVRDSKDRDGLRLAVPAAGWRSFIGRIQRER
ncbi:MAG TPA: DUF397 domain-containing protein [Streptosporangiaceae bacterium]